MTRVARTLASLALRLVLAFGLVVAVFAMHSAALGATAAGGRAAGADPSGQVLHDRGAHEPDAAPRAPSPRDVDAAHHHPGGTTLGCSSSACSATVLTLVALVACCPARPRNVWPRISSLLAAPLEGPEPPVPRVLLSA